LFSLRCVGRAKLVYLFGNFSIDVGRRALQRGGESVVVEPQVFDLLQYLVENRSRIVSKDDLIAGVWNGRIVSDSTLSSRMSAVRQAIGDSGEKQGLIRTVPRKGFRFIGEVREEAAAATDSRAAPIVASNPSIAVLPFTNMSDDPGQDYFVDGIVEDITTALSYFRWLFVIARSSAFTYKGRSVDVKQIGRELGVRYVLEGSIRKAARQVRITGQLIDASTGAHLWADRFDGPLKDIFHLQDRITASVVGAIGPKLQQAEIVRAKRKPTQSLDAYDYYLRGVADLHRRTKEATDEALRLFYQAIERDPDFATAYGMAAWCFTRRKGSRWTSDRATEDAEAERLARNAVDRGKEDALALSAGGYALAYVAGDLEESAAYIDRALSLNPNLATIWSFSGWVRTFIGDHEAALEHFGQCMRLSPLDPSMYTAQLGIAFAHFFLGRYDEALRWAATALRASPNYYPAERVFAASAALAGRISDAQKAVARMHAKDAALRISDIRDLVPLRRPEDVARYDHGLRLAGLAD
jgi:TolB-like protein